VSKDGRLQLRIDEQLKKDAADVAERKHTNLTEMVTAYLQKVVETDRIERSMTTDGEVPQV
jgi:antitoxin component of RelBE/YafQ-DinJ toxin-antitoxin module